MLSALCRRSVAFKEFWLDPSSWVPGHPSNYGGGGALLEHPAVSAMWHFLATLTVRCSSNRLWHHPPKCHTGPCWGRISSLQIFHVGWDLWLVCGPPDQNLLLCLVLVTISPCFSETLLIDVMQAMENFPAFIWEGKPSPSSTQLLSDQEYLYKS